MLIQFYQQSYRIAMLNSYQMLSHEWDLKESFSGTEIRPKIVTYAGFIWGGESQSGGVVQNMSNIKIAYTYQMDCEKHNKLFNN